METKKNVQFILKNTFKRYADLLLLGEEGKRHYVLIILIHINKDICYCL